MIDKFSGKFRFLSNFYPAVVTLDGWKFPTVEHAFQAAKTLDGNQRRRIQQVVKPGEAKRLGRAVHLRPDWEDMKIDVMRQLLRQKFSEPFLLSQLLATGTEELVEGNWWRDTFWGVCNGVGENRLGKLLMEIRQSHLSSPAV